MALFAVGVLVMFHHPLGLVPQAAGLVVLAPLLLDPGAIVPWGYDTDFEMVWAIGFFMGAASTFVALVGLLYRWSRTEQGAEEGPNKDAPAA
jgi:hypothetical protein